MSKYFSKSFLRKKSPSKYFVVAILIISGLLAYAIASPKIQLPSVMGLFSEKGLETKLDSAEMQISKGNEEAALGILGGFHKRIGALLSAGKIDEATYNSLYVRYSTLIGELGETPSIPLTWEVQYNADNLPNDAIPSWTPLFTPDVLVESIIEISPPGQLHTKAGGKEYFEWELVDNNLDNTVGATAEIKTKIVKSTINDIIFDLRNYSWFVELIFWEDTVLFTNGGTYTKIPFDTTNDFHIYRITLKDGLGSLYIDGELVIADSQSKPIPGQKVVFSGGAGYGNGEQLTDYIYYDTRGAFTPDEFPSKHKGLFGNTK